MNKAELIQIIRRSRIEWESLLAEVGEEHMDEPNVEGIWSVRDIIAHLTAYERWTAVMILYAALASFEGTLNAAWQTGERGRAALAQTINARTLEIKGVLNR